MKKSFLLIPLLIACGYEPLPNAPSTQIKTGPVPYTLILCKPAFIYGECVLPYRQIFPLDYACSFIKFNKELTNQICETQTLFEEEFLNSTFYYDGRKLTVGWSESDGFKTINGKKQTTHFGVLRGF